MEQKIIDYFINEQGVTPIVGRLLARDLTKYEDIMYEFLSWLENRDFIADNPIEIGGYTAKKISEIAPFLDGAGVYNFLVTLREDPEKGKDIIKKGFPRK